MVDQGVGDVSLSGCTIIKRRKRSDTTEPASSSSSSLALSVFLCLVSDDILVEIFVRLPDARTAVQFSSVCKHWHHLILRNPIFIQKFLHLHHHRQLIDSLSPPRPYTILFDDYSAKRNGSYYDSQLSQLVTRFNSILYESPSYSSGYMEFLKFPCHVLGSCNDLLFLRGVPTYSICNPITRKFLQLPIPQGPTHSFCSSGAGFVCQLNSSDPVDTTRYRYKAMLMSTANDKALIFSSDTGQWIISPVSFPGKVHPTYGWYSVSCNGVAYWLDGIAGNDNYYGIAAFDPFKDVGVEGRCRYIGLPVPVGDRWRAKVGSTCMGACQDKLRLSIWLKRRKGCFAVNIWELDGVASWNLVHQLLLRKSETKKMFVLAFHPIDGDVIFVLCDHHLFRYEIGKKSFQHVGQWPDTPHNWPASQSSPYPLVHPLWPSPIPALPST